MTGRHFHQLLDKPVFVNKAASLPMYILHQSSAHLTAQESGMKLNLRQIVLREEFEASIEMTAAAPRCVGMKKDIIGEHVHH